MRNESACVTVEFMANESEVTSEPEAPKPKPLTPEQEAEMAERVERAQAKIKTVLEEERCIITVPTLDISTGRIWPNVKLQAKP